MKKLLFYLLMLPLLCVLAACGEDEPNPDNPEPYPIRREQSR